MRGVDLAREVQALQPELVEHLVSGYADNVDIDPGHVRLAKLFRVEELAASLRDLWCPRIRTGRQSRQRLPELQC
jgi:hypothetical protein